MFIVSATDDEPLRCYQCRVEKNEECTDEYLRECPTDQAYDVCMVSVINNGEILNFKFRYNFLFHIIEISGVYEEIS